MMRYLFIGCLLVFACQSTKSGTIGTIVPPPEIEPAAPVDSFPAVPQRLPPMPPPILPEPLEPVPQPPPAATAPVQEGFWVQIFASHTSEGAEMEAQRARARQADPVQVQYINNLWKVRIGVYPDRQMAEIVRDNVRQLGWSDAWLVTPDSDIPISPSYMTPPAAPPLSAGGVYSVQVAASRYQDEGKQIMNNLISLGFNKVYLASDGELWKVRVGTFPSRAECNEVKEQLRNIGFIESFVVVEYR